MKSPGSILVVDDNEGIISALGLLLPHYFSKVKCIGSPKGIMSSLGEDAFNAVLLDMNFTSKVNNGNEGLFWLDQIKKRCPDTEVVLFTAYADIDLAIEGMKRGAFDFIVKPWDNDKLVSTLKAACVLAAGRGMQKGDGRTRDGGKGMYWGVSDGMSRLKEQITRVAATDASVLITGENGTGKDMLAKEIHRLSLRHKGPMVCVDMGAIPETLFESELFGHVKGAFTDARSDRTGKFEEAAGGTLLLDEIGNIPLHLQAKLLRALQDRAVVRVGSNKPVPVDIRLICATNSDIDGLVASGQFREDLFYRVNTIHLHLPPLRERRDEIIPLSEMFVAEFSEKYFRKGLRLGDDSSRLLREYDWYGNIRELRNCIEKAVILSVGDVITPDALQLSEKYRRVNDAVGDAEDSSVNGTLEDMEIKMISHALKKYEGNMSLVAKSLGITRQTLYNKMKRYNL